MFWHQTKIYEKFVNVLKKNKKNIYSAVSKECLYANI